jgi:hypothetical protein
MACALDDAAFFLLIGWTKPSLTHKPLDTRVPSENNKTPNPPN